jgi:hypothetical protein
MEFSIIEITLPNGRKYNFHYEEFESFPAVNELQHKTENIIINTDNIHRSFFYETDDNGEISYKYPFDSVIFI